MKKKSFETSIVKIQLKQDNAMLLREKNSCKRFLQSTFSETDDYDDRETSISEDEFIK